MENLNFYIFTGGPGSGKSTTIELLSQMGYHTVAEVGRAIIQKQLVLEGNALPWSDSISFAELMLQKSILDFETNIYLQKPCFFDRGIPDTLGYCRLTGLPVSDQLLKASTEYLYNPKVFLFPAWEAIYINDAERKQNFQEAIETCDVMEQTYSELGYQVVKVPLLAPEERAKWIISNL